MKKNSSVISAKDFQEIYTLEGAKGFRILNKEGLEFVELRIQKNAKIDTHSLPFAVFFYVVGGRGELSIDNDSYQVEKGDFAYCEKNKNRSWHNKNAEELRILVCKTMQ
jgi:quercetin dioxygenase-like cupin family protein